jgi:hypothetical protein
MEKNMLRKLFKHLLKKYSKNEKDRLEIMEELWNSVLCTYNEQTYPGNIQNMQVEILLSNPFVRYAAGSFDDATLNSIRIISSTATDIAIGFIQKEAPRIDKSGFDLLMKFRSIEKK